MSTSPVQSKIVIKLSEENKKLLITAANLEGVDLNAFILAPALEKARQIVKEYVQINLTIDGQLDLANALNNPCQPTQAMIQLMELPVFEKIDE